MSVIINMLSTVPERSVPTLIDGSEFVSRDTPTIKLVLESWMSSTTALHVEPTLFSGQCAKKEAWAGLLFPNAWEQTVPTWDGCIF